MTQFGASLANNSRVIIYNCNMIIVQATGSTGSIPTERNTETPGAPHAILERH
jgi:hypothetical protein